MIDVRGKCDALRDGTGRSVLGLPEGTNTLAIRCLRIGYGMGVAVECRNGTGGRRVSAGSQYGGEG